MRLDARVSAGTDDRRRELKVSSRATRVVIGIGGVAYRGADRRKERVECEHDFGAGVAGLKRF